MPSSVAHAFFALDVYEKLDDKYQKLLSSKIEDFKTFAEGPDPLFFYNLATLKRGKLIRDKYPLLLHETKTKDFFIKLIKYIKENNLENNCEILSFLYGFICHYALDSTTHPFIIYKTGNFSKDNKGSFKYNGLHADMEVYIDAYLIYQRMKNLPKNFKIHEFICNTKSFDPITTKMINEVFSNIYDIDNFAKIYLTSIKQMKSIFKIFRYDKYGIKKFGYKTIDKILPKSCVKKEPLSYHEHHKNKIHYLNLEKSEWNHPMYENERYNYSFIELYRIALKNALEMIKNVNLFLFDNEDEKVLNKAFKNLSYKTGKNCNDKNEIKYFEF